METQTLASDKSPTQFTPQRQSDAVSDALLLLSRLIGKQFALDLMHDPDILNEGGSK